jgi:hypothetical protein
MGNATICGAEPVCECSPFLPVEPICLRFNACHQNGIHHPAYGFEALKYHSPLMNSQSELVNYMTETLAAKGFSISPNSLIVRGTQWMVFERHGWCAAIDRGSGVWIKAPNDDQWRCLRNPGTISTAQLALEFLIRE